MKGLILSGGIGTRLRPFTYTRSKQLLPLANKPVLFYAIETLIATGIREIGIVVGDTHEEIRAAVGDGSSWGSEIRISYIHQEHPLGLAHAVQTAREFLGDERFIAMLGDNLIGESLVPIVQSFTDRSCSFHCQIFLAPVENPQEFGVAELEEKRPSELLTREALREPRVRRLVEKPEVPPSNLALVGVYCFDHHIFTAVEHIQPSARGELELTDAIQWLINSGYDVHFSLLKSYWIDTGKMMDILKANRQVLMGLQPAISATAVISHDSVLQGNVTLQEDVQIINSTIRGPAIIGKRSCIVNAYVGPFSSIYHDVHIENSEMEYCIVLENSSIRGITGRIEASLIGRNAEVYASLEKPRAHRLLLGDHSKVSIS